MAELQVVVASISHVGTRSIEAFLDGLRVKHIRMHMGAGMPSTGQNTNMEGFGFVIPMRDPRDVYESFYQSGHDLHKLHDKFGALMSIRNSQPSIVIEVDRPRSDAKNKEIGSFLSISTARVAGAPMPHLGKSSYHQATPTIPQWIERLRTEWGYSSTLNDSQS